MEPKDAHPAATCKQTLDIPFPQLLTCAGAGFTLLTNTTALQTARPQVTQLGDKQFRLALEDCLSFGKPMLIENIEEELDPVLDPVLERRLVSPSSSMNHVSNTQACSSPGASRLRSLPANGAGPQHP